MRYAPARFAAARLAEIVVRHAEPLGAMLVAGVLAGGYTGVAAYLPLATLFDSRFRTAKDRVVCTAASAAGSVSVAVCCVFLLLAPGANDWTHLPDHVLRFWVGDSGGIIVTTPFLRTSRTVVQQLAQPPLYGWRLWKA